MQASSSSDPTGPAVPQSTVQIFCRQYAVSCCAGDLQGASTGSKEAAQHVREVFQKTFHEGGFEEELQAFFLERSIEVRVLRGWPERSGTIPDDFSAFQRGGGYYSLRFFREGAEIDLFREVVVEALLNRQRAVLLEERVGELEDTLHSAQRQLAASKTQFEEEQAKTDRLSKTLAQIAPPAVPAQSPQWHPSQQLTANIKRWGSVLGRPHPPNHAGCAAAGSFGRTPIPSRPTPLNPLSCLARAHAREPAASGLPQARAYQLILPHPEGPSFDRCRICRAHNEQTDHLFLHCPGIQPLLRYAHDHLWFFPIPTTLPEFILVAKPLTPSKP
ncbi:hypothetical protein PAPYR_658 [Paratrimastix pyriformis]|uniref:Reverse transcriptase zinc-binding domain-containing protein n=1 Tax=Paratrimastix pyriformis TaxID=342808 RepID=A0ABQ8UU56_9EUKA|nr:hypothetical protein PAPYR_658 [Paratrimastix pyriformis]